MLVFILTIFYMITLIGICFVSFLVYVCCYVYAKDLGCAVEVTNRKLFWMIALMLIMFIFEWEVYGFGMTLTLHLGNFVLILIRAFGLRVVYSGFTLLCELV